MPPGLMTPSDDLVVDPAYWHANPEQEHLMRQQFNESVNMCPTSTALESDLTITILPRTLDTGSVTESESDPTTPTTAHIPPRPYQDDTGSTTESESEADSLLVGYFNVCPSTSTAPIQPCTFHIDTGSTMESESETDSLLVGYFNVCPSTSTAPIQPRTIHVDTGSTTESESEMDSLLHGYFVI
ncbi:hypothetical protein EV424DRAFT_1531929 [Suillus variegatus]|nr:hypothetical protein EV424DRAFT_1531929 [Suillus variegatus]